MAGGQIGKSGVGFGSWTAYTPALPADLFDAPAPDRFVDLASRFFNDAVVKVYGLKESAASALNEAHRQLQAELRAQGRLP